MRRRTSARILSRLQRTQIGATHALANPSPMQTCQGSPQIKKNTFSADITDLKSNLLVLTEKMVAVKATGKHRDRALHRLEKVADSHVSHFIEMNRHLEDLDNRGRRNNIRVRGIPETVNTEQIIPALQRVFISYLEGQEDTEIEFIRAHRALRARGLDSASPKAYHLLPAELSTKGGHYAQSVKKRPYCL